MRSPADASSTTTWLPPLTLCGALALPLTYFQHYRDRGWVLNADARPAP